MINMSTNGGGSTASSTNGVGGGGGGGIRNSMLRHWRNSTISLSRSGSRRGDKSEDRAAKRLSIPFISSTASTPKSPEAPAVQPPPKQTDADGDVPDGVAPPPQGISLHVTVHIAPENTDRFLAAFKAIFDVVSAEPECTFFEIYRCPEEPGKFTWVENWYDITRHLPVLQKRTPKRVLTRRQVER